MKDTILSANRGLTKYSKVIYFPECAEENPYEQQINFTRKSESYSLSIQPCGSYA